MALKNLLVRIGADASGMQAGLQKATKSLDNFKRNTDKRLSSIGNGKSGVGLSRVSSGAAKSTGMLGEGLSSLTKRAGAAGTALEGLTASLGAAGAAAGIAVVAIAAVAGAVALIGKGAQPAAKQESALMRLNLALGAGAKSYREWGEANAAALGLSERNVAEFGSTYGLALKGSIRDSKQLTKATEDLVRTTQVVASATGRSVEDVSERFRSGMLGETDAIEDLGIQVSASVIKTTKAFKELSKGKTWAQISDSNPALQKQIILMAILEQAQKQYGNSLQNNVITKQQSLSAALDNLKLHWSQAVLPIWKAVLPALTALINAFDRLGKAVVSVERLLGMDVGDVKALDDTTAGLGDVAGGYDAVADSAKKAKLGVAAFDEVNQLNWPDDSGAGGGGGGGSGGSSGGGGGSSSGGSDNGGSNIPPIFPPDAGKSVGTFWENIKSTVLAKVTALRDGLIGEGGLFPGMVTGVENEFQGLRNGLAGEGGLVPGLAFSVTTAWQGLNASLLGDGGVVPMTTAGILAEWRALNGLLVEEGGTVPYTTNVLYNKWDYLGTRMTVRVPEITGQTLKTWELLRDALVMEGGVVPETTNTLFNKWDYLGQRLAVTEPETTASILKTWDNLRLGLVEEKGVVPATTNTLYNKWDFLNTSLNGDKGLIPKMTAGILASWTATMLTLPVITGTALGKVFEKTQGFASDMVTEIGKVTTAFTSMLSVMTGANSASPAGSPSTSTASPVTTPAPAPTPTGRPAWMDNTPLLGDFMAGLDKFSDLTKPIADILGQFYVPGGGGALSGAGNILSGAGSILGKITDDIAGYLGNLIGGIPAFAGGAITSGPMLAMIGDNVGGEEVVSPLDDLLGMIQSAVGTAVLTANQASGDGQTINLSIDGVTLARIVAPYLKGETQRIGSSMISAF